MEKRSAHDEAIDIDGETAHNWDILEQSVYVA